MRDDDRQPVDLDERACVRCGRGLEPWDDECPTCREPAVLRFALPPALLGPPPAHLRDVTPEDDAGTPATPGATTAGQDGGVHEEGLGVHEEVLVPVDETDGLPPVPPVGGDPHLG